MNIAQYLDSKGINYKVVKNGSGSQAIFPCPNCGDRGTFAVSLETGAFNCKRANKCDFHGSLWDLQKFYGDKDFFIRSTPKYKELQDLSQEPNEKMFQWFEKRKISKDTVRKFRVGLSPNGEEIMFLYLKQGKLFNVQYRNMEEKKFRFEKECPPILWNQDNVSGKKLIITEGQLDTMSLKEYGFDSTSVPSGVNNMQWIENDFDYLEQFETIYLVMDNDRAGQSVVDNLANRLGRWRCFNVLLPYKDVNDCLISGVTKEELGECFNNAVHFVVAELKKVNNYSEEIIDYKNNPKKLYGTLTAHAGLTGILKGWRNEELTVWTGNNGSGKSTMLSQELIHLVGCEKKCCIGSFEMPPRKYLWWLIKQSINKGLITDEDVKQGLNALSSNLFVMDILGNIEKQQLFDIMEYGCRKHGIDVYVIDSLMKVRLTADSNKVLGEQKNFVSQLKDFTMKYKCHIHLVAHPRKRDNDDDVVGKSDISGTGDITNLADNVIVLHRFSEEQKKEREKSKLEVYDTALMVKKNREHGDLGRVGFYFDRESKTFQEVRKYGIS